MSLERADGQRSGKTGARRHITVEGKTTFDDRTPVTIARALRAKSKLGEMERKIAQR
ncbi:hypothetical protein N8A98_05170 [Devosia neptuniae]|uniref:Transposase n=1 Tax=Devosia neptuniae TaxID=191302 RepID=A0ABY6CHV4_9HYPH|nr:hypothetical protein [Devosia neptuniae]UXN70586.1 hypothetical protein N8A98_05170 [Devosia neptuniae]